MGVDFSSEWQIGAVVGVALTISAPRAVRFRRQVRQRLVSWRDSAVARARASSRVLRARIGYGAGVAVSAWGVGVVFGFGWALIIGGLATSVSFLVLYPVDESP